MWAANCRTSNICQCKATSEPKTEWKKRQGEDEKKLDEMKKGIENKTVELKMCTMRMLQLQKENEDLKMEGAKEKSKDNEEYQKQTTLNQTMEQENNQIKNTMTKLENHLAEFEGQDAEKQKTIEREWYKKEIESKDKQIKDLEGKTQKQEAEMNDLEQKANEMQRQKEELEKNNNCSRHLTEIKALKEEDILFEQKLSIALGELALKERINIHLCDNPETVKKINKKLEMQKVEEPSAKATQNNTRGEQKR